MKEIKKRSFFKFEVGPFKNWVSLEFLFKFRLSYAWQDHGRPCFIHNSLLKKWRLCFGKFGEIILTY